ncbi:hypothetical protein SCLCIDRAFT_272406 [Scleroderma citrinum Foug A]|uniref:Uncharacterized protein n=1 Tax=Scleroderma citrinum Foug A TaxID=1036808 RepID=A0A0C3DI38_9AGAM|nr:hypothetical protein SCLCIDRAFT_272406 [Scleroderma citrinum Foug A]
MSSCLHVKLGTRIPPLHAWLQALILFFSHLYDRMIGPSCVHYYLLNIASSLLASRQPQVIRCSHDRTLTSCQYLQTSLLTYLIACSTSLVFHKPTSLVHLSILSLAAADDQTVFHNQPSDVTKGLPL